MCWIGYFWAMDIYQIIIDAYKGYANYLWNEIVNPTWTNYFYALIAVSLLFFVWEAAFPWRKNQKLIKKDFFLDVFYMFFNFFLFSLLIFNAVSDVAVNYFNWILQEYFGLSNLVAIQVHQFSVATQLIILFVLRDFLHWNIHRLLHRVPFLWQFHKVHHSAKEMGFATHLRYHWMENILYKSIEYIPLAMIGFGIDQFFIVHLFALSVGHFNHANIKVPLGFLKYIFNNPQLHTWHHAKKLPQHHPYGMNYAITLSIWDYLFKTAYQPNSGEHTELGYEEEKEMPQNFLGQVIFPWKKSK